MSDANRFANAAAIVGMGDAYASKDDIKDPLQLASEAAWAALADAGITKDDIPILYTCRSPWADLRPQWNNIFASYMGLQLQHSTEWTFHGAGANTMLGQAAIAVEAGLADYVLCLQADAIPLFVDAVAMGASLDTCPQFEYPYGATIPSVYAQLACRYMHEFGVTERDFAEVAILHQEWAVHHPYAAKRKFGLIDVDTVMTSPYVAWPLRRFMCATWGPGGTAGAFVVTSAKRAAAMHKKSKPVYIKGFGSCSTHEYLSERINTRKSTVPLGNLPGLTTTGVLEAGHQAWRMAGLTPDDIDVVGVAANFSHTFLLQMEDLGFAPKGKGMDLVRSGRMSPGGDLPVDTNGGWMAFGQPGISSAADTVVEVIRQLRGNPLGRKADRPPVTGLAYGAGGLMACNGVVILSTAQ